MLVLLFYYLALPMIVGALVIQLIKRSGALEPPEHIKRLCADRPIEKRMFRAVRVDGEGDSRQAALLGDFETLQDAVDAIYAAKENAQKTGVHAAFLALNDKMEALEQIDS